MSCVFVENEDSCVRLRLRNTDANLLTIDVVRELAGTLSDAARAGRAVLLCGEDKFFCNGLDLAWALAQPPDDMRAMFLALGDLVLGMLAASVPIVGAIRGHAIGAGKTLFSACDVRYAAAGRVLVGVPEIRLGVPNPFFADQLLRFTAGDAAASDLIFTGRLIPAEEAVACGLVHRIADKALVEEEAWARTLELAALPRVAFTENKSMRTARLCATIRAELPARIDRLIEIWSQPGTQEILRATAARLSR